MEFFPKEEISIHNNGLLVSFKYSSYQTGGTKASFPFNGRFSVPAVGVLVPSSGDDEFRISFFHFPVFSLTMVHSWVSLCLTYVD